MDAVTGIGPHQAKRGSRRSTTRDARGDMVMATANLILDPSPVVAIPYLKGCANLAELVVSVSAAGCFLFFYT
jgi:hypothetical protein